MGKCRGRANETISLQKQSSFRLYRRNVFFFLKLLSLWRGCRSKKLHRLDFRHRNRRVTVYFWLSASETRDAYFHSRKKAVRANTLCPGNRCYGLVS